jgi:hypothetical protein
MPRTYRDQSASAVDAPPDPTDKEAKACAHWKRELRLADKREKDWRKESEKVVKRYRGEEKKRNRYNVLWSNTTILRPAIYNSKPQPDVRRRFRDADPIGKAVGEVLERSLYFMVDGDATDDCIKNDTLDALLCGRGVTRILYVPKLAPTGATEPQPAPDNEASTRAPDAEAATRAPGESKPTKVTPDDDAGGPEDDDGGSEPAEEMDGDYEQVEYEQAVLQHVDWQGFRHGYGLTWDEVPWCGFEHKLDRDDATKKFGKEAIAGIEFAEQAVEDDAKYHQHQAGTSKVSEFWEIWDKDGQKVFFIHDKLKARLFPLDNPDGEPPLELEGFFPCPKPLMLIENTSSLLPTIPFNLYEEQADQLDILTGRINTIIKGLRLRGIYDSKLIEVPDLLTGQDNQLTPVQNAQQWADSGGLEKAIAWMPVEQAAKVLVSLYEAREKQKLIIDELTGIMDIVRGATDPNETLGAQRLKSGFYSVRLWQMQQEVKRYARDLLRLAAQVMCSRFGADTFAAMTDLKFPTNNDRSAMQAKLQLLTQPPPPTAIAGVQPMPPTSQPPQPQVQGPNGPPAVPGATPTGVPPGPGVSPPAGAAGPPPPPNPAIATLMAALKVPTWEDILGLMHTPAMRQFRIDVETDSTISGTLESDMEGITEVLTAIAKTLEGFAPLVQSGALPADAAKELVMAVIRRARLGSAVEDQFEKMQAPKPPPPPVDTRVQAAQAKGQSDQAIAAAEQQGKAQLEQMRQTAETQRMQFEQHAKQQREQFLEMQKTQRDAIEAKFDAFVKIIVATISATKQPDMAVQPRADAVVGGGTPQPALPPPQPNGAPPPP